MVARLGERVEPVHVKDGPAARGEPQVAAGQGSVAVADALDAGRDSIRVHIIEADGIADEADIFDLVAESVAWLKERRPQSEAAEVDAPSRWLPMTESSRSLSWSSVPGIAVNTSSDWA